MRRPECPLRPVDGALGQAVFGVIVAAAVISSPRWLNAEPKLLLQATSLRRTANNAVTSVYMMIVAGAWLRHTDEPVALAVHLMEEHGPPEEREPSP